MLHTFPILLLPALFMSGHGATLSGGFVPMPSISPDQLSGARWEQLRARLLRIRADRLHQSVGVSREKAWSIAGHWGQFDLEIQGYLQHSKELQGQIHGILLSPISEGDKNAALQPLVTRLSILRQQQADAKRSFEQYVHNTLTPVQQGRFLLVVEELQRSMRVIQKN